MLKCGDVLRCIIMTIANVFTLLSTDISRKWTQQHFMGGRNIIEKLESFLLTVRTVSLRVRKSGSPRQLGGQGSVRGQSAK